MVDLELLIVNANVLTLDEENKKAGSVGVTNGRITGIWSEKKPPSNEVNITERTKCIDLQGATLLPGFIDTHNHMISAIMLRQYLDCKSPPNRDISDIKSQIKERALNVEKGSWIVGFGYDDTALSDMRHPTKKDLDEAAPEHPVIIYHISGHLGVANSLALEIAGVDEQTNDPEGGSFGRDEKGRLNGILYEGTAQAVGAYAPEPSEQELLSLISEESLSYLSQGITTNTDAKIGITNEIDDLELCFKAIKQGQLPMHMKLMIASDRLREGSQMGSMTAREVDAYIRKRSGGRASLDSAKMFQDGSIQGLTGALREPYFNDPGVSGDLIHAQEELNAEVKDLHDRGFRMRSTGMEIVR
ncbi:amidohydrolase family protein [Paenibacillus sp. FSL R10-2734]|uniref:amidohydrolase n=1 Tax=Paenibacillus sp. FSL R10-2734 TaxID=2954691 RepID=UPI0030DA491E